MRKRDSMAMAENSALNLKTHHSSRITLHSHQEVFMDIRVNDILVMKKPHPCGEKRWLVLRTGADFRLRCLGCGHELMTPRFKAEKNIRSVERKEISG